MIFLNIVYYTEINLICIILLSLILYQVLRKNKQSSSSSITFTWIIITTIIMSICDMIAGIFRGKLFSGANIIIDISNWLYFLSLAVISCLWTIYVLLKINEKSFFKKRRYWIIIPLLIYILIALTNPFTGILYTITEKNLYERGYGISIHWIVTWGYFLVATVMTIIACYKEKNKSRKQEIQPLVYFIITPLIAAIIQMVSYGVSSTQVGITISIIMIYIVLQNTNVFTDPLTELNNRRAFDNYVDNYIDKHCDKPLMVMIIDINEFKKINDQYGHSFGDFVLKEISKELKQACYKLSNQIFLCRYGGDEFLIANYLSNEKEMRIIKEAILSTIKAIQINEYTDFTVNACIGSALGACKTTDDVLNLIIMADTYMYEEKKRYKKTNN